MSLFKSNRVLSLVLLLSTVFNSVYGRRDQSSLCKVDPDAIKEGMGGEANQVLGWSVEPDPPTYKPGEAMTIKLNGPGSFKGLLLYVTNSEKKHIGEWALDGVNGFKALDCEEGATVSHDGADEKDTKEFKWTPPADATGDLTISGVIVTEEETTWQVLEAVIKGTGDPPAGGDGAPAANGTISADPPVDSSAPVSGPEEGSADEDDEAAEPEGEGEGDEAEHEEGSEDDDADDDSDDDSDGDGDDDHSDKGSKPETTKHLKCTKKSGGGDLYKRSLSHRLKVVPLHG